MSVGTPAAGFALPVFGSKGGIWSHRGLITSAENRLMRLRDKTRGTNVVSQHARAVVGQDADPNCKVSALDLDATQA